MGRFRTSGMDVLRYASAIIACAVASVLAGALFDWAYGDGFTVHWSGLVQGGVLGVVLVFVIRYSNRPAPGVDDHGLDKTDR